MRGGPTKPLASPADAPLNPQRLVLASEFPNIPEDMRTFLTQRRCQLPKTDNYDSDHPINVVSAHFARADQTDWAGLCVVDDRPEVVVLWGRETSCPGEIQSGWPLKHRFSHEADGLVLSRVGAKQILTYREFFGDEHSNEVNHEGIEVDDGQASLIYYCDGKQWLELQGND